MSALMGTFVSIKTMADGTPRISLDMQCSLSDIAAMGLVPGVPFALARLEKEASVPASKGSMNARQAALWCKEQTFWAFIKKAFGRAILTEQDAADVIYEACGIKSRAELDNDTAAERLYREMIVVPYQKFMRGA
jgi:hypothetical protein